jgi:Amt family ammonium transporter
VLGKRIGWRKEPMKPHSLPLVMLGSGLLWFGWFGFNAGSALGANETAAVAFTNTMVATAAAVGGWLIVERIRDGHPTSLGAASGAVAGLVAVTPACAFLAPWAAVLLGLVAGALCALAVGLKFRFGFDDSLDVVGVHLVGGLVGCLYLGFFATTRVNSAGRDGLFYGGGADLLVDQATGAFAVMAFSFVVTYLLGTLIDRTIGMRIDRDGEIEGIDLIEHAESAYEFTPVGGRPVTRSRPLHSDADLQPVGRETDRSVKA